MCVCVCVVLFQEYICIYFSSNICIRIWMHFNFVSFEFLQIFFISFFFFFYWNLQVFLLISWRMRPKVTYLDWVNFAEDGLIPISGAILINTTLGCWPAEHFHALSTQLLSYCFCFAFSFLYWGAFTYFCFRYCWVLGEFTKWNVLYKLHAYYYLVLNTYIYNIYI